MGEVTKGFRLLGTHTAVMSHDDGFIAWYRLEYPRVLAVLAVTAGSLEAAREAAAEGFARAYERWDRVSLMGSPAGWTYRVSLNELKRVTRRATRERLLLRAHASTPTTVVTIDEERADVWKAVAALPRRQRTAVVLRYVADMTELAIAEVMRIHVGTVSATLNAARRRLGALLEDTRTGGSRKGAAHG